MKKNIFARSPTLDTVLMVENFIKNNQENYTKRKIWQKLPKKVMWQTFNVIINYLLDEGKIGIDRKGHVVYIYNPKLMKRLLKRKEIEWKE